MKDTESGMEFEKIKEILIERFNAQSERITQKTRFTRDLGMDSLDVFQLMAEIEDLFAVEFASGAIERVKTVSDAVDLLKETV